MSLLTEINANTQAVKTNKKSIQGAIENKGGTVFESDKYELKSLADENIPVLDTSITSGKVVIYYKNTSLNSSGSKNGKTYKDQYTAVVCNNSDILPALHRANATYNRWYIEDLKSSNCSRYNYVDGKWQLEYFMLNPYANSDFYALYIGATFAPTTKFTLYKETNGKLYYKTNLASSNIVGENVIEIYDPNALPTFQNLIDGVGSITELKGEERTISPTTMIQEITPSADKNGITKVTVEAVTSAIDSNIVAENIKKGVEILGVIGTLETGTSSNDVQVE